jgi:hypothetical protein
VTDRDVGRVFAVLSGHDPSLLDWQVTSRCGLRLLRVVLLCSFFVVVRAVFTFVSSSLQNVRTVPVSFRTPLQTPPHTHISNRTIVQVEKGHPQSNGDEGRHSTVLE